MSTLRLPMRTSPGPQPSRSPKTSKYMYSPAACKSPGRVKLRHFSKRSLLVPAFFLPGAAVVGRLRIVFNSIRRFDKSCTASRREPPVSDSSAHCLQGSTTFRNPCTPNAGRYQSAPYKIRLPLRPFGSPPPLREQLPLNFEPNVDNTGF